MRMKSTTAVILSGIICATLLSISACDSNDDNETTVNVTLREFSVTADRASVDADRVTFVVTNSGTEVHEFVVIKTNLQPDALPTEENGSYEENGAGTQLLGEVEDIAPGTTQRLTLDVSSGGHVLICNRVEVEGGEIHSHYAMGMRTAFSVE